MFGERGMGTERRRGFDWRSKRFSGEDLSGAKNKNFKA
jgi:hypothetical protein